MSQQTLEIATRIYSERVDPLEIARSYLSDELSRLNNPDPDTSFIESHTLDAMPGTEVWSLLEALSGVYRKNTVFEVVGDSSLDWYDLELPVEAITVGLINPGVDEVISSPDIDGNPLLFAEFLDGYFEAHSDVADDPRGLNEFRRKNRNPDNPKLVTREIGERVHAVDGSHRLIAQAGLGATSVRTYCGLPNSDRSYRKSGEYIFSRLKTLFVKASNLEEREAILQVVSMTASNSSDGAEALSSIWIDRGKSEEMVKGARLILGKLTEPKG